MVFLGRILGTTMGGPAQFHPGIRVIPVCNHHQKATRRNHRLFGEGPLQGNLRIITQMVSSQGPIFSTRVVQFNPIRIVFEIGDIGIGPGIRRHEFVDSNLSETYMNKSNGYGVDETPIHSLKEYDETNSVKQHSQIQKLFAESTIPTQPAPVPKARSAVDSPQIYGTPLDSLKATRLPMTLPTRPAQPQSVSFSLLLCCFRPPSSSQPAKNLHSAFFR